jgi:hypothetical protein
MVVTVANIRAAQNAPINAENISRGSMTARPQQSKVQLRRRSSPKSIRYLSSGAIDSTEAREWNLTGIKNWGAIDRFCRS